MAEEDIEEILRRQDEAMALLERLRLAEPVGSAADERDGGGRRDFRRWPIPEGVTLELHDTSRWQAIPCSDMGIGGARISALPEWMRGPVPARLKAGSGPAILTLADTMWRDAESGAAGLRFEFLDIEERDYWTGVLIDALLARYSL